MTAGLVAPPPSPPTASSGAGPEPPPHRGQSPSSSEADALDALDGDDAAAGPPAGRGALRSGLAERHLSMLGVARAIGTSLFLGLGAAVRRAGPLGALLGYATVGLLVCAVQFALSEAAALLPVTGAFVRHAELLVDPAWGFAVGWNLVYGNLLSVPSELTAICVLVRLWPARVHPALVLVASAAPAAPAAALAVARVAVLGEVEFALALLKLLLVVFLVLLGLVIDLGGVPGTPPL